MPFYFRIHFVIMNIVLQIYIDATVFFKRGFEKKEVTMGNQRIEVSKNGPYMVKDVGKLLRANGTVLEAKPMMALCACGGSSNKPYCDGTHMKNGFVSDKKEDREENKVTVYKGKNITIYDNRGVCSHRGYCTDELSTVFGSSEPWINPDGDSVEAIIALCEKCPSGALSYQLPNMERVNSVDNIEPQIKLSPERYGFDGPYDVVGGVEVVTLDGEKAESEEHCTLCRCGHSKNKPFCSGEHWHVKFKDEQNS